MKVRFRPEAALELREARDWYAAREERLGKQFVSAVDAVLKRIVVRPQAFPALTRPTLVRRAQLRRFPFVLFRILGNETIEVLAVAHVRRRPGYWRSRMR